MAIVQNKGLGRRKASIARVYIQPGAGEFIINGKALVEYFPLEMFQIKALQPLNTVELAGSIDVKVNVKGGGIKGQAEAIALGLSRALCEYNEELRSSLKSEGLLKRDARVVERKKPGLRKARKKEQYSKR